jgi:hypothetical protein
LTNGLQHINAYYENEQYQFYKPDWVLSLRIRVRIVL